MNPNGKIVKLILWLYSMEPPFYAAVNEANRTRDKTLLTKLGAWSYALYFVLGDAELKYLIIHSNI